MGALYIDKRGTKLGFEGGAIVIREPDAVPRTVPIGLIDRLVVVGKADISSGLLLRLAEDGASVTVLSGRRSGQPHVLHSPGHGDVLRRMGQYRLHEDDPRRADWARRLLRLRLAGQRRLLSRALQRRPDLRYPLKKALRSLADFRCALSATSAIESLRGLEGAATAAFYQGYRTLFAESLGFLNRNRRPPRDPVNAALSLGYTLSHSDAARAAILSGLDPAIGVYHELAYGRDSLACDLNEIARSSVEFMTWRLFAEQVIDAKSFYEHNGGVLIKRSAHPAFFQHYESAAQTHRRWLRRAAMALARECEDG